ncbi:Arc family DNA-binding protein [Labrys sp. KB_33_2]|uniref:Arc family DNA-binding protein n=1 Tax=Labrys sp. KB_33_2 TaxID=3237479 RepID=UPI003F8F8F0D
MIYSESLCEEMMPREPQINVRLPDDMRERLKTTAKRNRRSMNSEFVLAVSAWLEREERPAGQSQNKGEAVDQCGLCTEPLLEPRSRYNGRYNESTRPWPGGATVGDQAVESSPHRRHEPQPCKAANSEHQV